MDYIIGIDFDNTLVSYDDLIFQVALEKDWVSADMKRRKKDIRDAIRQLPNGEIKWQRLQAEVYGPRMSQAKLIEGVWKFLELCRYYKVAVSIVSHKTKFAEQDSTQTNLRQAALSWMKNHKFFDQDGLGMAQGNVYFKPTRQAKVAQIDQLGCTHFIDDLEETFQESSFPAGAKKILYSSSRPAVSIPELTIMATWQEITNYFFNTEL